MNLSATSRSIVIAGTKRLREKYGESFRSYAKEAAKIKRMKLEWKVKQDTIAGKKLDAKAIKGMKIRGTSFRTTSRTQKARRTIH